ncbi:MAG: alanine racemase, partial [Herpetosiphon sp.]|nr:alanine racemase [Herpetosiphon sp.]
MTNLYQTYKQTFDGQTMPFAFVDLDRLNANIKATLTRAGAKMIRIASKSIRSRGILARILAAHSRFQGIMCFTAAEAVWLSQHGFDHLLLGYPCWNEAQIRAICAEIRQGKNIVLMLDSLDHVNHLDRIAASEAVMLPVCLDIDMSLDVPSLHFGVWRSSVASLADALLIYQAIERTKNIRLDGVMGYEAQIAGVGDNTPNQRAKNAMIRVLKQRSIMTVAQRRESVVLGLRASGADLRFVNGGGTGSLESTIREPWVTEVTVGSGFYAPSLFDHYHAFRYAPAAGFALEIVRQPKPNMYTCLGGGYIASGSAGTEKLPTPYLPEGAELISLEG